MKSLVLLAEDNEDTVEVMQRQLEFLGYRVTLARNGVEAVARAIAELPDLIVMDVQMPLMDGLQAAAQIHQEPKTHSIPILAATAKALSGDREKCLASGFDGYLAKPFTHKQLGVAIEQLLNKARADRS
jgi:CheY-like chemotaxis protein